jgi:vacuolar-type H+-ATPase subunit F/Vma7
MSMGEIVFFGAEAEAAGWRLAGIDAVVAPSERMADAFDAARRGRSLLLLDAATAARLPPPRLAAARTADAPLLCVLPAAGEHASPDPVVAAARRQLGMDE